MLYRSIQNIDIDKHRRIISSSRRCLPLSFYHVVSTLFVSFSSQTTERDELFTPLDSHHNNSLSALSVEIKGRQPRKLRERINRTETFDHCKNKTKFFFSLSTLDHNSPLTWKCSVSFVSGSVACIVKVRG